ncbi:hypothetical protein, partial [Cronobacter sakazakii]
RMPGHPMRSARIILNNRRVKRKTMDMDIESLIAAASRAQQASEHNIGNCSRIWHFAFFYDGMGRNIEREAAAAD